ncbi:MAG: helix-turn-helix domain-containing protein [Thomasclavelia sp.]
MKSFAERLALAMSKKNFKQADLIKQTGINKGALSSYLNGRYEPKLNNIYLLSKALGVSEAWLMGYDVPMYDLSSSSTIPTWYSIKQLSSDEKHNNFVELIEKIQIKYPNDKDIFMLISSISSYLQHIDNIMLNNSINEHDVNKKINYETLKLYFDLNNKGQKLIYDYVEMIHSKSEYISEDAILTYK